MNLLSASDLQCLSGFLRAGYEQIAGLAEPLVAAFDSASGFKVEKDLATTLEPPFFVTFAFKPRDIHGLAFWGMLSDGPPEFIVFVEYRLRMRWSILLESGPHAWKPAGAAFLDWVSGAFELHVNQANSVPYQLRLLHEGVLVGERQSVLYPWWGKRTTIVRRNELLSEQRGSGPHAPQPV